MSGRRVAVAVAVVAVLLAPKVAAEPPAEPLMHIVTEKPRTLCVPWAEGSAPTTCRTLPPGHFVNERAWSVLDTELRRLQDRETRLDAENRSLRESAAGWQPGWRTLAVTLATGVALGVAAYRWLD